MIIETIKATNSFQEYLVKQGELKEGTFKRFFFFATGHKINSVEFEMKTKIKTEEIPESRWFMASGRIPDAITSRSVLKSGTETLFLYETEEEMCISILKENGLHIIKKTDLIFTCEYKGKNKGSVIGRKGCVLRFFETIVGKKIVLI